MGSIRHIGIIFLGLFLTNCKTTQSSTSSVKRGAKLFIQYGDSITINQDKALFFPKSVIDSISHDSDQWALYQEFLKNFKDTTSSAIRSYFSNWSPEKYSQYAGKALLNNFAYAQYKSDANLIVIPEISVVTTNAGQLGSRNATELGSYDVNEYPLDQWAVSDEFQYVNYAIKYTIRVVENDPYNKTLYAFEEVFRHSNLSVVMSNCMSEVDQKKLGFEMSTHGVAYRKMWDYMPVTNFKRCEEFRSLISTVTDKAFADLLKKVPVHGQEKKKNLDEMK